MSLQKDAIIRLLSDDDPPTVNLVKEQLAMNGEENIDDLKNLLGSDDENVRRHVGDVLAEIDRNVAEEELSLLCPLFHEDGDIEQASWLLARVMIPGVDVRVCQKKLAQFGKDLANMLSVTMHSHERIHVIAEYLGDLHGFRGNMDSYYTPDNSLLPRVLDTKLGIPISLTLLYMLVGARAKMPIEGVNMPGHFLARHDDILFDPFEKGRIITLAECTEILARQNLSFNPEHLEVSSARIMFRRMLTNLLYVYQNNGDEPKSLKLAEWINGLGRS
jgi:regulator of sirC expression with transglutaminase-like and TPR domain